MFSRTPCIGTFSWWKASILFQGIFIESYNTNAEFSIRFGNLTRFLKGLTAEPLDFHAPQRILLAWLISAPGPKSLKWSNKRNPVSIKRVVDSGIAPLNFTSIHGIPQSLKQLRRKFTRILLCHYYFLLNCQYH